MFGEPVYDPGRAEGVLNLRAVPGMHLTSRSRTLKAQNPNCGLESAVVFVFNLIAWHIQASVGLLRCEPVAEMVAPTPGVTVVP